MKIAVCEDNTEERSAICFYIRQYCEKNGFLADIDAFLNGEELLRAFDKKKFDIIFLDIIMTGMTGIDTARKIRQTDPACVLIFITSSEDYAFDAYSVRGRIYVKKPVDEISMTTALKECRSEFVKNSRYITVKTEQQIKINLLFTGIRYIEVYNKEILFHMTKETIAVRRMTLDEVEQKLGGSPFLRCHRSYIVNMNYADKLSKGVFIMKSGEKVPVRKNGYAEVQLVYGTFLTERFRKDAI